MARFTIRDLFKLRVNLICSNSTSTPIQPSKPSQFCSFCPSNFTTSKTRFLYKQTLDFLDSCQTLSHLFQIQSHLITSAFIHHPSFAGRLLKISSHLCELDYTVFIFKYIKFPSVFCVNTVIKAYACSSVPKGAVIFYIEMLRDGFFPNSFSFTSLFSAGSKMVCLNLGLECHAQAVKFCVDSVLSVQNSMIHFYSSCGLMAAAKQVLDEMSVRDVVSWNGIIHGYAKASEIAVAHELFDGMPERNIVSWNIMISGYLNWGNPGNGLKLFRKMAKLGLRGNDTTVVNVLTSCGRSARLKEGKSVHGFLIRDFGSLSLIINTALVDMYCRCKRLDVAQLIFDRMFVKNLVSWNIMILGHCLHGNPIDGLNFYAEMTGERSTLGEEKINFSKRMKSSNGDRIVPDEITFVGVFCACAREGKLAEGKYYFSQMIDVFGLRPNFAHYWCMANIFAKVGLRKEAMEFLRNIPVDDDASPETSLWANLFSSCRFQGDVALGEQLAKELIEQDPQNFSYYKLLVNVYAAAGRWEDVAWTKAMMNENRIRRIPGCGLEDLKEIVHSMKVGKKWQELADRRQISTQDANN